MKKRRGRSRAKRGGRKRGKKPVGPSARDRALAGFLGLPTEPPATLTQRIGTALHDEERLRASVARLEPVARAILHELVATGGSTADTLTRRLGVERGIPEDALRSALQVVQAHALAEPCSAKCRSLHPLTELGALRGDALAFTARALDPGPEPLPLAFRVALVAAYVAQSPPGLTKTGRIYARWMRKAEANLRHASLTAPMIECAFELLFVGGALVPDEGSSASLLHLDVERAVELVSHSSTDLALAVLGSNPWAARGPSGVALAALERVRAAQAPEGFVSIDDLCDAAATLATLPRTDRHPGAAEYGDVASLAHGISFLWEVGLVECAHRGGAILVRRATSEEPPHEHWSILPNLDVLVPASADPRQVVRLGCAARIASVDRVARFELDRPSVQRATLLLEEPDVPGVIELLAGGARHGVPENVAANVRSWLEGARPATSFVGAVVVVQGSRQAATLLRVEPSARELAPGTYGLDPARLPKVLRALEKDGTPVAPTRNGHDPPRARVAKIDIDDFISEQRRTLAAWASIPVGAAESDGGLTLQAFPEFAPHEWLAAADDPGGEWGSAPVSSVLGDAGPGPRAMEQAFEFDGLESVTPDDPGAAVGVWETLSLGKLRTRLRGAAEAFRPIDLMYVTATGGHEAHLVLPKLVTVQGRREVVRGEDLAAGRERRFYLDRVVALREVDP